MDRKINMPVEMLGSSPIASDRLARPLSPATRAGDFVFVSGQVPTNDQGEVVAGGIEAQTRQVFERLKQALALAGCTLDDVCKERGLDPISTYRELIQQHDVPKLKSPYNLEARRQAGFEEEELIYLAANGL